MPKKWEQYTGEEIEQFVKESFSYAQLAKKLGYAVNSGSSIKAVKEMIQELNIDVSHFTGQGWNKNNYDYDKFRKYDPKIENPPRSSSLREPLIYERGKKCENCGLQEWLDKPIKLEVHHIDGDKSNNVRENLLLLCPNCHSYTENYCKVSTKKEITDEDLIEALQMSPSINRALIKVGMATSGGNYARARRLIEENNISHLQD